MCSVELIGPEAGEEEVKPSSSDTSVLPSETLDRKESVELWKCSNETDVIGELGFLLKLKQTLQSYAGHF